MTITYYLDPATGADLADVTHSWPIVTEYEDGGEGVVAAYQVHWSTDGGLNWALAATVSPETTQHTIERIPGGTEVQVAVRAVPVAGSPSELSVPTTYPVLADTTAPPVPLAATYVVTPGQLTVAWSGALASARPADYKHVEVHVGTTAAFALSSSTLAGALVDKGTVTAANPTNANRWIALASIDIRGNRSTPVYTAAPRDETPPPVPTTPTLAIGLRSATVSWNGSLAAAIPDDFSRVEIHRGTTAAFTPSASTLIGTLQTAGSVQLAFPPSAVNYLALVSVDLFGNKSAKSTQVTFEADTTPPPVPTVPTVATRLGAVVVTWDGALVSTTPPDFSHVEVHLGSTATFTASATTLVGNLSSKGLQTISGITVGAQRWARLRSVDIYGNASSATTAVAVTVAGVAGPDVAVGALTANNIAVGGLDGIEITGLKIQSSAPGSGLSRWEADTYGIRLLDAAGVATIDLDATTGRALITGEIQTKQVDPFTRLGESARVTDFGVGGIRDVTYSGVLFSSGSTDPAFIGSRVEVPRSTGVISKRHFMISSNLEPGFTDGTSPLTPASYLGKGGSVTVADGSTRIASEFTTLAGGTKKRGKVDVTGDVRVSSITGEVDASTFTAAVQDTVTVGTGSPTYINGSIKVETSRLTSDSTATLTADRHYHWGKAGGMEISTTEGVALFAYANPADTGTKQSFRMTTTGARMQLRTGSSLEVMTNYPTNTFTALTVNNTGSTFRVPVTLNDPSLAAGSGQLLLNGPTGVALRYNASTKLATSAAGVDVTGTLSADVVMQNNGGSFLCSSAPFANGSVTSLTAGQFSVASSNGTGFTKNTGSNASIVTVNRAGVWMVSVRLVASNQVGSRGFIQVNDPGGGTNHYRQGAGVGEDRFSLSFLHYFLAGQPINVQLFQSSGAALTATVVLSIQQVA